MNHIYSNHTNLTSNKMKKRLFLLFAVVVGSCCISLQRVFAEVIVSRIFSNNMVLQRGINAPVWGTASPGEKVSVEINGLISSTIASKDGKWKVYLPVFEAGGT